MKIKRCPFCGRSANLMQRYSPNFNAYFLYVECSVCGARGKSSSSKEKVLNNNWQENKYCIRAVESWNNRIPMRVAKKWARDWIRPIKYNEDGSWKFNPDDTQNFIMIGDLDNIFDYIYDEEESEWQYGKLV